MNKVKIEEIITDNKKIRVIVQLDRLFQTQKEAKNWETRILAKLKSRYHEERVRIIELVKEIILPD